MSNCRPVRILRGVALRIPGGPAAKDAGLIDDFGHRFFLAIGHDVHAAHSADLTYRLDQLDADIAAFAGLVLRSAETGDDRVRDMHTGNILAHPLRRFGRAQRTDAGEYIDLAEEPERLDLFHEAAQQRQVKTVLSLDELRARGDFLRQPLRPPGIRQTGGIFGGAEKHTRRVADLAPALKMMIVAQGARDIEQ